MRASFAYTYRPLTLTSSHCYIAPAYCGHMQGQMITEKECRELVEFSSPACLSIYTPTDPLNSDPKLNKIAFKNLVQKATKWLAKRDAPTTVKDNLSQASDELLEEDLYWKDQANNFALYVAQDRVRSFKLQNLQADELVMLANHFYVVPLMAQLNQQATFYVLEVDRKEAQLWIGTQNTLTKVDVPDLPKSIEEVVGTETEGSQLQFHTGTSASNGSERSAVFHSSSSSWKDDHDRYLKRFLKAIDTALVAFFKQSQATSPLLLMGAEEPVVAFQKISRLSTILESTLPKIPDTPHKEKMLHEHSWNIISKHKKEKSEAILARYEEAVPAQKVALLSEIVRQAALGKIDTLLLAANTRVWGVFDSESLTTIVRDSQNPMSEELLNTAARLTHLSSGKVYILPREKMPEMVEAAAILRY